MMHFWFIVSMLNTISVVNHAYCYDLAVDNGENRKALMHVALMTGCCIAAITSLQHI